MWARPPPKEQPIPAYEAKRNKCTLSEEKLEENVARLYTQAMERKKGQEEKLWRKHHKEEPAPTMSTHNVELFVERHYKTETEHRAERQKKLENKHYKRGTWPTMSSDDTEETVNRLYGDPRRRQETMKRLERKIYGQKGTLCETKKMDPAVLKSSSERLAQPAKREFTDEETNKILGI
eukprot:Hpha_TRINITY_DN15496_c0_g11::TRINITY_DN15496_c0_g11_i1::g.173354::m.173354